MIEVHTTTGWAAFETSLTLEQCQARWPIHRFRNGRLAAIRQRLTAGNPVCPECGEPSYKKTFVGEQTHYFTCASNRCFCAFDADGKKVGLS